MKYEHIINQMFSILFHWKISGGLTHDLTKIGAPDKVGFDDNSEILFIHGP